MATAKRRPISLIVDGVVALRQRSRPAGPRRWAARFTRARSRRSREAPGVVPPLVDGGTVLSTHPSEAFLTVDALGAWAGLLVPLLWFGPLFLVHRWREREWLRLVDARVWRANEESPYDEIRNASIDANLIGAIRIQWRERGRLAEADVDPTIERMRLRVRLASRFLVFWIFLGLFPVAAILSLPASLGALLDGRPTPNLVPAIVVLVIGALVAAYFGRAYERASRRTA